MIWYSCMNHPKLRPVEAFPVQNGLYCMRDPLGFSAEYLFIEPIALFICTLFDGTHSSRDIQQIVKETYGIVVREDMIDGLIHQLDSCLFLENGHFYKKREMIITDFKKQKRRSAIHAGGAYESDPEKCREQLDSFFVSEKGPGLPDSSSPSGKLCGLVAPHIDLHRGGICFAHSYAELARENRADIFIILGIAHSPTRKSYVLTDKDFETPLGTLLLNRDIAGAIKSKCTHDFYVDEYVHKNEHSIEFQALFLKYLYPNRDITMVPVLCSSMYESIINGTSPYEDNEVREFVDILKTIIQEYRERICLIAGVDFSHVGKRFGTEINLSAGAQGTLEKTDQAYLESILLGDAENFIKLIAKEQNKTNVCGVPALYTLLKVLEPKVSKYLGYDQAVDEVEDSIVSFAGAAFYRE
jgi:MEMO1 family protein